MKKLYSIVTGVDKGSVQLFSDFDDGGPMWTGSGERQKIQKVAFTESFKSIPTVSVSLEMWDMHSDTNQRFELRAINVTETGFEISFKTWGDTRIARARVSWMAIGEARGDDDWEIDYGS